MATRPTACPCPLSEVKSLASVSILQFRELNPQSTCLQLRQPLGARSLCLTSPPEHEYARYLCPTLHFPITCQALVLFSVSQSGPFSSPLSSISNPVRILRLHPFRYQPLVPKVTPNLGYSTHCAVTLLTGLTFTFRTECPQHTFAVSSPLYSPEKFFTGRYRV